MVKITNFFSNRQKTFIFLYTMNLFIFPNTNEFLQNFLAFYYFPEIRLKVTTFLYIFGERFHITLKKLRGHWTNSLINSALKVFKNWKFQNHKEILRKFIGIRKNKQIHFILKISKSCGDLILTYFFINLLITFCNYCYAKTLFLVYLMSLIFFQNFGPLQTIRKSHQSQLLAGMYR